MRLVELLLIAGNSDQRLLPIASTHAAVYSTA
jgi:hypothetical protein